MQQLTEAIDKATGDKHMGFGCDELRNAASRWADHAVRTYDGSLLRRALAISEALANFCNGVEKPELLAD